MEGEVTGDVKIVCHEVRKTRRISLILSTWSETLDDVGIRIEDRDLTTDLAEVTEVQVPLDALLRALNAIKRMHADE